MPDQITGYYVRHQEALLRDFDAICALTRAWLVARHGQEVADTLTREARLEYETLIPHIPYIRGPRARALNTFLLISAQELAVYKALTKHGKSAEEAWELCHAALRLGLTEVPRWKRRLLRRFMFSRLVRTIAARRARRGEKLHFGDFELEFVIGEGDDFDFGVNYLRCGNHTFVMAHGGEEFAPYVCMSDIALSEAMGWGLVRTQTLADGCAHCDFRFKKGAPTRISSRTPDVQAAIDRIRRNEPRHGVAVDA